MYPMAKCIKFLEPKTDPVEDLCFWKKKFCNVKIALIWNKRSENFDDQITKHVASNPKNRDIFQLKFLHAKNREFQTSKKKCLCAG